MKMKIRIRSLIPVCMALAVHTASAQVQPVDYVDMFMGNRGESNCVIGPQLPHGSVNPSPQTPGGGNDGYDPLQPIRGFGQLHVSGTGWGRYGQILLSPQVGFSADEQGHDSPKSGESALPYYYAVTLDRYGIRTELAPTHNAAIYRFSFPAAEDANILLDIAHNIPQHIKPEIGGRFLGGAISYDPETGIIGGWGSYRGGFGSGAPYKVYFAAALDRAPRSVAVTDDGDGKLYARIALPPFDAPGTVLLKRLESVRRQRELQRKGRFADSRLSAQQNQRPRHHAAAQYAVHLAVAEVHAAVFALADVAYALGLGCGQGACDIGRHRAAFAGDDLLGEGVPFAARGTAAQPFGSFESAVFAEVCLFDFCHRVSVNRGATCIPSGSPA